MKNDLRLAWVWLIVLAAMTQAATIACGQYLESDVPRPTPWPPVSIIRSSEDPGIMQSQEPVFLQGTPVESTSLLVDRAAVMSDAGLNAPKTGDGSVPKKKKKEWYEKIGIRGYAQFRYNDTVDLAPGSAPPQYAGDSSISPVQGFLIRRARLIFSGDISDRLYLYFQPDFASNVPGATDGANQFAQLRDCYGDIYLTTDKVNRVRVGQSKVPYGWENLQSSQNRIALDRADGLNSAVRNERDLGVFYYWTPEWAQGLFKYLLDENLKGSGNYGIFGFGAYNGQGGSFQEQNNQLHLVSRLTLPFTLSNGQIMEVGMQGYTGQYVVFGTPIRPLGVAPAVTPAGTGGTTGIMDERLAWSYVIYPQPLGFQTEWTIGRGPGLNDAQTEVIERDLRGGYAMLFYKLDTERRGTFFPYVRYSFYQGGYKSSRNAPYSHINEGEFGCEWQFNKATEMTLSYLVTDRTNLNAMATGQSYRQFDGDVLRLQVQINY